MRHTLRDLPCDVHVCILAKLPGPSALGPVALSCIALSVASRSDDLWRFWLEQHYHAAISNVFDGVCPLPVLRTSFRDLYLTFSTAWMSHARAMGKTILEIEGVAYDVTDYIPHHPGEPELLLAAGGTDATDVFAATGHTANARKILATFSLGPTHELVPPLGPAQGGRPRASASPTVRAVLGNVLLRLRSAEGRGRLRELARTVLSALFHDLTEGRPDCRRYAPAVLRLAASRLFLAESTFVREHLSRTALSAEASSTRVGHR